MAAGAGQVDFDVFRATPGQPVIVRLIATDERGPWPRFVGAGTGVGM